MRLTASLVDASRESADDCASSEPIANRLIAAEAR